MTAWTHTSEIRNLAFWENDMWGWIVAGVFGVALVAAIWVIYMLATAIPRPFR